MLCAQLKGQVTIRLVEAMETVLSMFDKKIRYTFPPDLCLQNSGFALNEFVLEDKFERATCDSRILVAVTTP
jgi:hypothetical protein